MREKKEKKSSVKEWGGGFVSPRVLHGDGGSKGRHTWGFYLISKHARKNGEKDCQGERHPRSKSESGVSQPDIVRRNAEVRSLSVLGGKVGRAMEVTRRVVQSNKECELLGSCSLRETFAYQHHLGPRVALRIIVGNRGVDRTSKKEAAARLVSGRGSDVEMARQPKPGDKDHIKTAKKRRIEKREMVAHSSIKPPDRFRGGAARTLASTTYVPRSENSGEKNLGGEENGGGADGLLGKQE